MMDADGQHPPKIIPQLLEASRTYDMVVGARTSESDSAIHRDIANIIYNKLASYITNFKIEDLTSGFRIIKRDIANEFLYLLPNQFSYTTTLTLSVIRAGYNLNYIPFAAPKRVGKSKIKLLRDGSKFLMIILRIAVFFAPLKIFTPASILFFLTGLSWYLFRVFGQGRPFPPVSSLLMITAVLIFFIGLVSEQIANLRYARTGINNS
ncbi:MAG: glycosyltransferase family 2 protein, partial [Chloroflexota bacterium]